MKRSTRSASLLLLRRRDGRLEVFWVRRGPTAPFLGGFHAFPGGLSRPGEPLEETALRETWEETGYRAAGPLFEAGRWHTPEYVGVRIETQLFAVFAEDAEPVVPPDDAELDAGGWIRPEAALARWDRGEALMAPPTLSALRALARGAAEDPAIFLEDPEAHGVPPSFSFIRPHIAVFPVRTPTLPPATHTNCYVIGDRRLAVVDPASPFPKERARLDAWIDGRIAAGAQVQCVLLTHHHRDHVSGARHLADRLGVPILAHPATRDRVGFAVDGVLGGGDAVELGEHALEVHFTPGHAPGHLCFVDRATRSGVMGDMVAGLGTILIEPGDGHMATYLASLEALRRLGLSCLMPSHGPVMGGADHVLGHYIRHRLAREAKVVAALDTPRTVKQIVGVAYADAPLMARLGPGGGVAGLSVRAHLQKLEEEGRAVYDGARWRAP